MNASTTDGPARSAIAAAVRTNSPAPMIAPMPRATSEPGPSVRLSVPSPVEAASASRVSIDFVRNTEPATLFPRVFQPSARHLRAASDRQGERPVRDGTLVERQLPVIEESDRIIRTRSGPAKAGHVTAVARSRQRAKVSADAALRVFTGEEVRDHRDRVGAGLEYMRRSLEVDAANRDHPLAAARGGGHQAGAAAAVAGLLC